MNVKVGKIYAIILYRCIHGVDFFMSLTTIPVYLMINSGIRLLFVLGTDRVFLDTIAYIFSMY